MRGREKKRRRRRKYFHGIPPPCKGRYGGGVASAARTRSSSSSPQESCTHRRGKREELVQRVIPFVAGIKEEKGYFFPVAFSHLLCRRQSPTIEPFLKGEKLPPPLEWFFFLAPSFCFPVWFLIHIDCLPV